jgi:alkylhydroperoxidase family enzyme
MIRALVLRKLDSVEKELGASVDYLRFMVGVSLRAFFKFARILPLAQYRRVLPVEPHYVAVIVATRDEDCGTCVQIGVNQAKKAGVPVAVIRNVLDRQPDQLPDELADVYRFTESVVTPLGDDDELRERIRKRYGDEGLIELALAMASCRVFPITKRALGYAKSCSLVRVEV